MAAVPAVPTHTLNDGTAIPAVGFGCYTGTGGDPATLVASALASGYRLLDTALRYDNEDAVGAAVRDSGLDRDEVVVTTKLPGRFQGRGEAREALETSLGNLGLDRIDLYLIHWPLPRLDRYVDTWRELIAFRDEGLVRSIGVCNFTEAHLTRLIGDTGVVPAVNQVELHPYWPQDALRAFHAEHGIVTEGWSPIGRGALLRSAEVSAIAETHGVSTAQTVLRWQVQVGSVPLPKSSDPERQRANLDLFGFALTDEEMATIAGVDHERLSGQDPDEYEEF